MVRIALQSGVRPGRGTQERQTIAVGNQSTPRRPEGEISGSGKRYAEGTPVQPTVEQSEITRVDIHERSLVFEGGQIKRKAFDLRGLDSDLVRGPFSAELGWLDGICGVAAVDQDKSLPSILVIFVRFFGTGYCKAHWAASVQHLYWGAWRREDVPLFD
jgi:hypothetical protein